MQQLYFSFALSAVSYLSFSQNVVPLYSVSHYIGKTITVCGKVASSFVTNGPNKTCFLHMGGAYPTTPLTLVIFNKTLIQFTYNPSSLFNKVICVKGKISTYKNVVQMVIDNQSQVTVREK